MLLRQGNSAQRLADSLLTKADRLLSTILFWNLLVNITYFALATMASKRMDGSATLAFSAATLLTIIFFGEMLPKSLGVLQPRLLASFLSVPLAAAVKATGPLLPVFRWTNILSLRLLWPKFRPEPYLELADLERAIEESTEDAKLLDQERTVLENIVSLSNIRADELMRPRRQFLSFPPPVRLEDLQRTTPRSGYILITEPNSDEIAAAIPLQKLRVLPDGTIEQNLETLFFVPWCASVASVLDDLLQRERRLAGVVNEYGETIGIITYRDIRDTVFSQNASRSHRLLNREPIQNLGPDTWDVTGMTRLRRLSKHVKTKLPESKSQTVSGVVQEVLQRLPVRGDKFEWGPFEIEVLDLIAHGQPIVRIKRLPTKEDKS